MPGSFPESDTSDPPPDLPANIGSPRYTITIKQVIEERDRVVVLALVEGIGLGVDITTIFGTPCEVEIFEFDKEGLTGASGTLSKPISEQSYDFR